MRRTSFGPGRAAGFILALTLPLAAAADTVYITDRIQVGLHEEDTLNSAVLGLLPSGTALEVLERDGLVTRVRTEDGREGWVDRTYLSEEPPATARLAAENESVVRMQEEATAARGQVSALEERLAETRRQVESLTAELAQARESQRTLESALAEEASARREAETALEGVEDGAADNDELSQALRDVQRLAEESHQLKQEVAEFEANRAMVADNGGRDRPPEPDEPRTEERPPSPTMAMASYAPDLFGFIAWEPWQWLLLISGLALAFGAGGYVVDLGVRRRHGGFRI